MKIVHFEFGKNLYGGSIQVSYLLDQLRRDPELENHVICPEGSEIWNEIPELPGIHRHPVTLHGELDPIVYRRIRRIIRSIKPDIIHIHSRRGADFWGVMAARLSGIPYILTRRVDNVENRRLLQWRASRASYVVGISRKICEVLEAGGVPSEKIQCIHSRVDTDYYRPGGDKNYLAREAGLAPEDLTVGIIAQLIERKGHRVLFESIPKVLKAHPKSVFLVFGKGTLKTKFEEMVAKEQWADRVRFMGFRNDMVKLLPALDIVVHPAFMEGLGVALLQAAACAVPIVASDAGGIPEIVRHGFNGYLVPPGDPEELAERLSQLLADSELRLVFGATGREIVEKEYSIPGMAKAYLELYKRILG